MKFIQKLANERFARSAAQLMKVACYLVICFYVLCAVLSFMGRQSFFLHTKTGIFERAIYAEENHDAHSRSMTVFTGDEIHVWTNDNDQIDLTIQIGLSLMYALLWDTPIFSSRFRSIPQTFDLLAYQPYI